MSEDVLNSAMRHFAHGRVPRRHVGLAPGPLEARKRATKRRMMNLAQVGGGEGFNPGVLPGLGAPERVDWTWQSPTPLLPRRSDEVNPLPAWLSDPPPIEADERLTRPEKDEEKDEDFEQKDADLQPRGSLANPKFWEELKRCRDIDGLYNCAAGYGIDIRVCPKPLFRRLCHAGQPLPVLLHALEDAALGTTSNLNFLLIWHLRKRKGERRLRKRIKPDDINLLQQWMRRQLYLGLKTEEDILVFLKFVTRVSDATSDEFLRCNLIASVFEGLQASSILGLKDLGTETQCRLLESVTRGPVTRQSLDLGFGLVEAMQELQLENIDKGISAFVGGVIHAHGSLREHEKRETRFLEVVPRVLEMIGGLPQELKFSVILTTTKALINAHLRMSAIKAATMQLLDTWWSALAKIDIVVFRRNVLLKTEIELLMSTQELEVVVPYLQQLDDRKKACFVLRYWVGPKTSSGRSRARYLFDEFCSAKGKDSPWVSMFQAARECAQESSRPTDPQVRLVFKVLQMLRQSDAIVEIIKQARKLHAVIDESDVVYTIREHLGEQPNLAERFFHFYPRLPLETCPELAERMILNPRSHPCTALKYMRNRRLRFHFDRKKFLQLRKQLLDRMALAYSTASHLSPGTAFEYVYDCYTEYTMERIGAPSATIARAITRAGLIRPLQAGQWVSTTKVRWILRVVRDTESTDVADQVDEIVYKWRGSNVKRVQEAARANVRARQMLKHSPPTVTRWSKYYLGYERIYTFSKIPRP